MITWSKQTCMVSLICANDVSHLDTRKAYTISPKVPHGSQVMAPGNCGLNGPKI